MMYLGKDAIGLATSIPEFANIAKIECGNYTPTQDELITDVILNHSLGEIPDFLTVFIDPISLIAYDTSYLLCGTYYRSYDSEYVDNYYFLTTIYNKVNTTTTGSTYGGLVKESAMTNSTFTFPHTKSGAYGATLKANTTYHYIIGKFKEVTANANE